MRVATGAVHWPRSGLETAATKLLTTVGSAASGQQKFALEGLAFFIGVRFVFETLLGSLVGALYLRGR